MRTNDENFRDYIEKLSVKKKVITLKKKCKKMSNKKWFIKKIVFKGSSGKYIEEDIEKRPHCFLRQASKLNYIFIKKFN